jgi:hypothetical protein
MPCWQAPQASPASSREPRSRNPTECPTIRSAALFMVAARSAPSRVASIRQQAAALAKAFPLDRALRPAAVRASRSERPRKVELYQPSSSSPYASMSLLLASGFRSQLDCSSVLGETVLQLCDGTSEAIAWPVSLPRLPLPQVRPEH